MTKKSSSCSRPETKTESAKGKLILSLRELLPVSAFSVYIGIKLSSTSMYAELFNVGMIRAFESFQGVDDRS